MFWPNKCSTIKVIYGDLLITHMYVGENVPPFYPVDISILCFGSHPPPFCSQMHAICYWLLWLWILIDENCTQTFANARHILRLMLCVVSGVLTPGDNLYCGTFLNVTRVVSVGVFRSAA